MGKERVVFESVGLRLAKYDRVIRISNVLASVIVAEVSIYASVNFGSTVESPVSYLGAAFVSLMLLAGVLLGWSRGKLDWQRDLIHRALRDATSARSWHVSLRRVSTRDDRIARAWPMAERIARRGVLQILLSASGLLLFYIWAVAAGTSAATYSSTNYFGGGTVVDVEDVYFGTNSAAIDDMSVQRLGQLVRALRPGDWIVVEGHSDSPGPAAYNLRLSAIRAERVKHSLMNFGLDGRFIVVLSYGESLVDPLRIGRAWPADRFVRATVRRSAR